MRPSRATTLKSRRSRASSRIPRSAPAPVVPEHREAVAALDQPREVPGVEEAVPWRRVGGGLAPDLLEEVDPGQGLARPDRSTQLDQRLEDPGVVRDHVAVLG